MSSNFYRKYQERLSESFPRAAKHVSPHLEHLISPFIIELPQCVLHQAQELIQTLYKLSRSSSLVESSIFQHLKEYCPTENKNSSLLMAYDFHLVGEDLKLIEVNTNASGFTLCDISQQVHGMRSSLPSLEMAFRKEMRGAKEVFIVDDRPQEQKMYGEFVIYQEWLLSRAFQTKICDFRDFKWVGEELLYSPTTEHKPIPVDFIYNRYCDFLLSEEASKDLSAAYRSGRVTFSPQPREYILLADKQRLADWSLSQYQSQLKKAEQDILKRGLIKSQRASSFGSYEKLWGLRKNLFFKPKNSYGGKSAYRGKSLSKKNLHRVIQEDFLVQEFSPPPEVQFKEGESWKYDLRFYTFKDEVQLCTARIYRGQLTNFKERHGGFTTVSWI